MILRSKFMNNSQLICGAWSFAPGSLPVQRVHVIHLNVNSFLPTNGRSTIIMCSGIDDRGIIKINQVLRLI